MFKHKFSMFILGIPRDLDMIIALDLMVHLRTAFSDFFPLAKLPVMPASISWSALRNLKENWLLWS